MQTMGTVIDSWLRPPPGGYRCADCGAPLDFPGICEPCAIARKRRAADASIAELAATIPPRFAWAAFDSPELPARVRDKAAIKTAEFSAARMAVGTCRAAALLGPAGAGKTSLACAMLRHLLATPKGFSGRFCASTALSVARADSGLGREPELVHDAIRASVLVLDDFGQEAAKGIDTVVEVIHARHDADRPTIVTSWLDAAGIAKRYGGGTARRVLEGAALITVGGA